ncbi:MAG: hypothetical protein Q4G59_12420 [Planctomycetia bacterium]|nr:hypothetical protein [Planctomycetia bacterium]
MRKISLFVSVFMLVVLFSLGTNSNMVASLYASDEVLDEIPDIEAKDESTAKKDSKSEEKSKTTSKLYAGVRLGENIASIRKRFRVIEENRDEDDYVIVYVEPKYRWYLAQGLAFKDDLCTDIEVMYSEPTRDDINEFRNEMKKQLGPIKKSTEYTLLFAGTDNDITMYAFMEAEGVYGISRLTARWSITEDQYDRPDFNFRPNHFNKKRRK